MTRSDELILAAIKTGTELSVNGRSVSIEGSKVTVSLYDAPTVCVIFDEKQVWLYSDIPVTRKSAKVVNAVLGAYTDFSLRSLGGIWLLERRKGEVLPVGKNSIKIPMTRLVDTDERIR